MRRSFFCINMSQYYPYGYHQPKKKMINRVEQGCFTMLLAGMILFGIYLLLPTRTNILVLGLDAREGEGYQARSDTMILVTMTPLRPQIGMLSVPRDLGISSPSDGENRIKSVHFFAEGEEAGKGHQ